MPTNMGLGEQSNQAFQSIIIKSYYLARAMFKQSPQFAVMLWAIRRGKGIKTLHLIWVYSWLLHPIYSDLLIV